MMTVLGMHWIVDIWLARDRISERSDIPPKMQHALTVDQKRPAILEITCSILVFICLLRYNHKGHYSAGSNVRYPVLRVAGYPVGWSKN